MKNYTLRNAKTVAKFAEQLGQWNGKKLAIELVKLGAQKVTVEFIGGLYLKAISEEVSAEEVKAILSNYTDRVELTSKELDRVAVSFADYLSKATFSDMFETPDFSALNDIQNISVIITNHMYTTLLSTLWTKNLDFRQSELLRKDGFIFADKLEALAQTEEATKETAQTEEATKETAQAEEATKETAQAEEATKETIFKPLNLEAKYNVMQIIISEAIQTAEMCVNKYNNWGFKSHINPDRATASLAELFQNKGLTVDKEELAATVNKFLEWFKWELEGYESKPTLGETLLKYDLYGMICELLEPIMEDIASAIDPELLEQDYDRIDCILGEQINLYITPQARLLPDAPF